MWRILRTWNALILSLSGVSSKSSDASLETADTRGIGAPWGGSGEAAAEEPLLLAAAVASCSLSFSLTAAAAASYSRSFSIRTISFASWK